MPALFSRLPLLASLCYRFLLFIDPHIHSYRVLSNNSDILVRFHCNSKWYRKEIALFFLLTICSIHLIVLSILVPVALNVIFQSFIFCSQVSAMCWLSRLINLNWRFPQAAFPSSNERQVPVKVGAILLSNIKIEAFSSLSGAWRGLEGVIAPTGSHHLLCLFTLSLVPFFGACRVFKSLAMPLMPPLIFFRICTGSIRSADFKAPATLHLLLVTISEVFPIT